MGYLLNYSQSFSTYGTYVNVKQFGAKGDGVTDDTAAIQSALNGGGSIYFPQGNYKVTQPLNVTVYNTQLFGNASINQNGNGSVIQSYLTSGSTLNVTTTAYISNLSLNGTNAASGVNGLSLGGTPGSAGSIIMGVTSTNFTGGSAIVTGDNTYDISVSNSFFQNSEYGVNIGGAGSSDSGERMIFDTCSISNNSSNGIIIQVATVGTRVSATFTNCDIDFNNGGILNIATGVAGKIRLQNCDFNIPNPASYDFITYNVTGQTDSMDLYIINCSLNGGVASGYYGINIPTALNGISRIFVVGSLLPYNPANNYIINNDGTPAVNGQSQGRMPMWSYAPNTQLGTAVQPGNAPSSITVGASPFTFTPYGVNAYDAPAIIAVVISGGAGVGLELNGTTLASSLSGTETIIMRNADSLTVSYTTAPTMYWYALL